MMYVPPCQEAAPTNSTRTIKPDWTREEVTRFKWDPGRQLIRSIREYQDHKRQLGFGHGLMRKWSVLKYRFWSVVASSEVPINSHIAGGLCLPHPVGIVIHPDTRIGANCMILQQVTIGTNGRDGLVPEIGAHVFIGAGAKLLGGIKVGVHARIGANAVVLCDVPEFALAVGIPARIVHDSRCSHDD